MSPPWDIQVSNANEVMDSEPPLPLPHHLRLKKSAVKVHEWLLNAGRRLFIKSSSEIFFTWTPRPEKRSERLETKENSNHQRRLDYQIFRDGIAGGFHQLPGINSAIDSHSGNLLAPLSSADGTILRFIFGVEPDVTLCSVF